MSIRFYGSHPYNIAVIHGGPGAPGSVAAVARHLSRTLGEGVLEPLQTALSLDGQVQELSAALTQHAAGPAVLVGHSWGAWLSVLLAVRHPRQVKKLLLVSSAAFEDHYVAQMTGRRLQRLTPAEGTEYTRLVDELSQPDAPQKPASLARLGELAAKGDDFETLIDPDETAADHLDADGDVYQSVWGEAAALRQSGALLEMAAQIRCPLTVIHGLADSTPPEGVVEPLRKFIPDLKAVYLEKCGHTPWKERYAREVFYTHLQTEIASSLMM